MTANASPTKSLSFQFPLWLRLDSLLFLSHLSAALAALWLEDMRLGWLFPALAAAGLGAMLTLPLSLALETLFAVVHRLEQQQATLPLAARRFGPLAKEAALLNALVQRLAEVTALRSGWLAQAQETAAQQERNRLGRELHDSIKQQLFSLQMSVAAAQEHLAQDEGHRKSVQHSQFVQHSQSVQRAQAALQNAHQAAQEALAEMNALLQQLSPAPLEKVGLVQALRDQCEALGYRSGAAVSVEFGMLPGEAQLPPGAQDGLFRIAQEALSNIARHARARQVRLFLGLTSDAQAVELHIQDDGQGFDLQMQPGGMGLGNMRQRAQALGGKLSLSSAPGAGVSVHLVIPLLSPFDISEENMSQTDHTLNKVFAAGLMGGLALIALLYYPLYVIFPGGYVEGWTTGQPMLGLILQGAAALAAIAAGYGGARWAKAGARPTNLLLGALSGSVAGLVLFFGLAGSAAGLAGNALIIANGPVPTPEDKGLVLLVESIRSTIQLCYGLFWLSLASGGGLGALGGLLAPLAAPDARRHRIHTGGLGILTAASLGGAFFLALTVSVYSVLEPSIYRSIEENNLALSAGPAISVVTLWPFTTAALLYLSALLGLYLLLRSEARQTDQPRLASLPGMAYFYASLALVMSLYLGQIVLSSPDHVSGAPVLGVSALVSLALGGLFALTARQAERQAQQAGLTLSIGRFSGAFFILGSYLIGLVIAWLIGYFSSITFLLPLILIIYGLALALHQWRIWKQGDVMLLARQWALFMQDYTSSIVGAILVLLITLFAGVPYAISLVMIPIPFIAPMFATPESPYDGVVSITQQVQQLYLANANLLLAALVICAAAVGLVGVIAIFIRRQFVETKHLPQDVAA